MTKAQGRRHNKLKGYYERQYARTEANKLRRARRRELGRIRSKRNA